MSTTLEYRVMWGGELRRVFPTEDAAVMWAGMQGWTVQPHPYAAQGEALYLLRDRTTNVARGTIRGIERKQRSET